MIKRTSGLTIPKNHHEYSKIVDDLIRYVQEFNGDTTMMTFFEDIGDSILIPRYYPIDDDIVDESDEGVDIEIESSIKPRNKRQTKAMEYFRNNTKGILQLEPGSGKTIITVDSIANVKKKAVIFAHKTKLLDQWRDTFLEYTNLTEDDIGYLSGKKYEECLSKKIILSTPQVVAYAAKRNDEKMMACLQNAGIGIIVIDECHVGIGPEQFSKSSIYIPAKRTWGLSATPSRSDGNNDVLSFHLGDITTFAAEEGEMLKPTVHMLHFPFGVFKRYKNYCMWGGKFNMARYYKQMVHINSLHVRIAGWIQDAYKKNRKALVLGNQIKPLLALIEQVNIEPCDVGIFIPGARDKKYKAQTDVLTDTMDMDDAFYKKRVVFSTYKSARDGNNRPELDCLIMVCHTSNVEQAAGRILRECENKKTPVILDLVDTEGPRVRSINDPSRQIGHFEKSAERRYNFYKSKGWDVKVSKLD